MLDPQYRAVRAHVRVRYGGSEAGGLPGVLLRKCSTSNPKRWRVPIISPVLDGSIADTRWRRLGVG